MPHFSFPFRLSCHSIPIFCRFPPFFFFQSLLPPPLSKVLPLKLTPFPVPLFLHARIFKRPQFSPRFVSPILVTIAFPFFSSFPPSFAPFDPPPRKCHFFECDSLFMARYIFTGRFFNTLPKQSFLCQAFMELLFPSPLLLSPYLLSQLCLGVSSLSGRPSPIRLPTLFSLPFSSMFFRIIIFIRCCMLSLFICFSNPPTRTAFQISFHFLPLLDLLLREYLFSLEFFLTFPPPTPLFLHPPVINPPIVP